MFFFILTFYKFVSGVASLPFLVQYINVVTHFFTCQIIIAILTNNKNNGQINIDIIRIWKVIVYGQEVNPYFSSFC